MQANTTSRGTLRQMLTDWDNLTDEQRDVASAAAAIAADPAAGIEIDHELEPEKPHAKWSSIGSSIYMAIVNGTELYITHSQGRWVAMTGREILEPFATKREAQVAAEKSAEHKPDPVEGGNEAVCVMDWSHCTESRCGFFTDGCPHITDDEPTIDRASDLIDDGRGIRARGGLVYFSELG